MKEELFDCGFGQGFHFDVDDDFINDNISVNSAYIQTVPNKSVGNRMKYALESFSDRIRGKIQRFSDRLRGKKTALTLYLKVFENNSEELYAPGFEEVKEKQKNKGERFEKFFGLSPRRFWHLSKSNNNSREKNMELSSVKARMDANDQDELDY